MLKNKNPIRAEKWNVEITSRGILIDKAGRKPKDYDVSRIIYVEAANIDYDKKGNILGYEFLFERAEKGAEGKRVKSSERPMERDGVGQGFGSSERTARLTTLPNSAPSKHQRREKTTLEKIQAGEPVDSRIESITEARTHPLAKPLTFKNLPCTDLEAMLEECDRLTGATENRRTYIEPEYNQFRAGVMCDVVNPSANDVFIEYGKTRREAVQNLLKKLRERD